MSMAEELKSKTKNLLLSLLVLMAIGAVCGIIFRDPIMGLSEDIFKRFGPIGLVIGTLITDTSPLPLTSEPVALIGIAADIPIWQIIVIMGATSHLCGPLGYGCGFLLGKIPTLKHKFQKRYPTLFNWVNKHGVKGVAFAAILPIPYALSTWISGLVGVSFWGICLVSGIRWIKTALYVSIFAGGWLIGA